MSDSDDEIFWGPVTVRELQIISQKLFPADGQENKKIESESEMELSQELNIKEKSKNENCIFEDCTQYENIHDESDEIAKKIQNSEFDLPATSNVIDKIPEIVISDLGNHEQNDPCANNTITSATVGEHDITDRATDDGYDSAIVDTFIQENDSISKGSDIQVQSTEAREPVMTPSNSEVYFPVSSENMREKPKEKHSCVKDDTFLDFRTHTNDVSIEHNSSSVKISANATYSSSKCNISNSQNTFVLHDGNDSCKSTHADISSSPFLTTNCSVDTHLSKSFESSLSNDLNSMSFQNAMVSLNFSESQLRDNEALHERTRENCQDLASFSNCEAFSNGHESILSNLISEVSSQTMSKESNTNLTTCLTEEAHEHSIKDNHASPVFKNSINDKSSNDVHAGKVTVSSEHFYASPVQNIACTSKIPVLQKTPSSASGPSKKRGVNVKSNSNECSEKDNPDYFPNSHPFYIPGFPVAYDINTDNLVTRSPNGNIIPTACNGSSVQTSTSISANYVHVMTSEKISELAENGFFMKSSPCTQDVPPSNKGNSSEFEDSDLLDIEAENGSVLCSSSLTSSSSASSSLNCTLEEMEMMMKHGYEYMCGKDDSSLNADQEGPQKNALPVTVPKPGSEKQPVQRGLKQCQYIRTSHEEIKPFHKELNDIYADVRTPKLASYAQKPSSALCARQLQRLKKTMNFSNIRSPVGAYIKDRPVQLLRTCGKVKPFGRDDVPSRMHDKECVGSSAKQIPVKTGPALPEIVYEKAPGINVNPTKTIERCGPSKKNYTNPTVIKHAGRAVLATVPHNALQMIKNTEISVLYDKDVSKTATL